MSDQNYTAITTVDHTPEEAFVAINNVRGWWAGASKAVAISSVKSSPIGKRTSTAAGSR